MPSIHLEMPDDVKAIVLQVQMETKLKKNIGKYSQQTTIYQIIREYKNIKGITTQNN